uniref:Trk transporter membrane-spanning protein-K+ transport n=1 Tax=Vibrio coralliilyticus TaxID=190893 RepID=M1FW50_9VIBR|nr:potassium transporter TrkG [Vibrio coralliilyticus]AFV27410.1 Trk transporter membrane-spanning protein - K+ transport [Vibrio coralliilyticus]
MMKYSLTWDLESIFPGGRDSAELQEKLTLLDKQADEFTQHAKEWDYDGDKPNYTALADMLTLHDALMDGISQTYTFVEALQAENVHDKKTGALFGKVSALSSRYKTAQTILTKKFVSFPNAGFDNLGALSLQKYVHDPLVNIVIIALIVLGGIGFSVWFDVTHNIQSIVKKKVRSGWKRSYRLLKTHTRLAINMTVGLIFVGTLMFLLVEWSNPTSIGTYSVGEKILAAMFQTVTMRTAGFATIDYELVKPFTLLFFIFTMFIGGSPGGAAGGIKTTTFALIFLLIINEVKGQKYVNYANHSIPIELVRRAIVVVATFLKPFGEGGKTNQFHPSRWETRSILPDIIIQLAHSVF